MRAEPRPDDELVPERLRDKALSMPGGAGWLAGLGDLVRRVCTQWGLEPGRPFVNAHVALVAPATRADGTPVVIKIPMPSEVRLGTLLGDARTDEATALRRWNGGGAVALLDHDRSSGAMLLEHCHPGTSLSTLAPLAADEVAVDILTELQAAPAEPDVPPLTERARRLAQALPGRWEAAGQPFDETLIDRAVHWADHLITTDGAEVMLHGDLHHDNVLSAQRRPWLAIDPLPAMGDPAYDLVPYLLFRKGDLADPQREWSGVITRVSASLGVDPGRVVGWTILRLVSDALAAAETGTTTAELEAVHGDLWTVRLLT